VRLDDLNGEEWELLQWAKFMFYCSCGTKTPAEVRDTGVTCTVAAENGHLNLLKLARTKGYKWDQFTCYSAAKNGHFEVLKWARENGCLWDEGTCAAAASCGRLDILQWARANGCPWDERTCCAAAANGHADVWKWARVNGCPFKEMPSRFHRSACRAHRRFKKDVTWEEVHTRVTWFRNRNAALIRERS
jgi:hypothetical protein